MKTVKEMAIENAKKNGEKGDLIFTGPTMNPYVLATHGGSRIVQVYKYKYKKKYTLRNFDGEKLEME